jgi:UDP-N-acetylmuramate--alanine ligase
MREAKKRKLPIVRRAEVLAELMRLKYGVGVAGSHGKTTTTSMCGAILDAAGLDPTVVIGGQVKSLGTGGRLGKGDFLVAESAESDRSFLLLKPTVAIVTNIDDEHMNSYRSRRDLEESFRRYVESVPFYGLAILCIDDPALRQIADDCKRRVLRYGFSQEADLRASQIVAGKGGMDFSVSYRGANLGTFHLPMFGRHLVQNSLAAIGVALEFGIPVDVIRNALRGFGGVKRRLEVVGTARGVTVMNDYGHHPTEIRATLRAIKECFAGELKRLVVLFQPHRYSRTQGCWDDFLGCFDDADHLVISEIYAAGESPVAGVSGAALCNEIPNGSKHFLPLIEEAPELFARMAMENDVVLCLGAGSVGSMPEKILEKLKTVAPCSESHADGDQQQAAVGVLG